MTPYLISACVLSLIALIWFRSYCKNTRGASMIKVIKGILFGVKAWHFLPPDKKLRFGDRREVTEGGTITVPYKVRMCNRGLHGSPDLLDALQYAPGLVLTRVLIRGGIRYNSDKIAGKSRKCLRMYDRLAPVFLRWMLDVLLERYKTDPCWAESNAEAIQVIRRVIDEYWMEPESITELHAQLKAFQKKNYAILDIDMESLINTTLRMVPGREGQLTLQGIQSFAEDATHSEWVMLLCMLDERDVREVAA